MKKLLLLIILTLGLHSCSLFEDYLTQKKSYVKVLPTAEVIFSSSASSCSLTIESSDEWTITGVPEWANVMPDKGDNGAQITISVLDNESSEKRSAELIIVCDDAETTVTIIQKKKMNSDYIDMYFDGNGVTTNYNETTGELSITYANGNIPEVEQGNTIVLPAEYLFDIRVVESVSINNNTITLSTTQGNMCNLFRNTSFTLSTNGDTRAAGVDGIPVIAPVAIGYLDEGNNYIEVYNANDPTTRTISTDDIQLWKWNMNFNNATLYKGSGGHLWWDRCAFNAGLNGSFNFSFSEKPGNGILGKVGELEEFGYVLSGSIDADLLIHYLYQNSTTAHDDRILKYNVIPTRIFSFLISGVPVHLLIYTHLGQYLEIGAGGKVEAMGGVNLGLNIKSGLSWSKKGGVVPTCSATPHMNIYHPTIKAEASAHAKASYYPQVEIGLYKFFGPWFEPRPYIKEKVDAGFRASTDGENYIGWTDKYYSGLDMRMGLKFDFGFWDKEAWRSNVFNLIDDTLLTTSPERITLVSPENGTEVMAGESVDVSFVVEAYSPITGKYWACNDAAVVFETECGELSNSIVLTDDSGLATVTWTPEAESTDTETRKLKAKIVNSDGTIIDEEFFEIDVKTPLVLNHIDYDDDYYYYEKDGENYIAYNCTANISGNTSEIENLSSCGIYIHDSNMGKNYIWKDGLSGDYSNEDIDFFIGIPISNFDNLDYTGYYAESTIYSFGTYVEFNDGTYYWSEPKPCSYVYKRNPSYKFLSVGKMTVSVTGSYEDDNGETITEYKAEHPYSYAIDGALWIENLQWLMGGENWVFTATGEKYGETWTPSRDRENNSATRLNTYNSNTNMSHVVYQKIVTKSGKTEYSNSLVYGGTPESPTVSIGGVMTSSVIVNLNSRVSSSNTNTSSCGHIDGVAISDIEINKENIITIDNLKEIPMDKIRH